MNNKVRLIIGGVIIFVLLILGVVINQLYSKNQELKESVILLTETKAKLENERDRLLGEIQINNKVVSEYRQEVLDLKTSIDDITEKLALEITPVEGDRQALLRELETTRRQAAQSSAEVRSINALTDQIKEAEDQLSRSRFESLTLVDKEARSQLVDGGQSK